jgi:hypothetical protein
MKQKGSFNWEEEWLGIYFALSFFGGITGIALPLMAILDQNSLLGSLSIFCTSPFIFAFGLIGFITRLHFHRWHRSSIVAFALAIGLLSTSILGTVLPENYQQSCEQKLEPYADLTQCDFSGQDLSGMDLQGAILDNSNLNGTNLNGAALTEASIRNADLSNADLTQANLTGANLNGAKLQNTNFTDAILNNAHLTNTDITTAIGFTGEILNQLASYDGLISEKPDERYQILENVCNGQGYENAISYTPSTHNLSLVGIELNQRNQEKLVLLSDKIENHPIILTALVACVYEEKSIELEVCFYSLPGHNIPSRTFYRSQEQIKLEIREIKTGTLLQSHIFSGPVPPVCPGRVDENTVYDGIGKVSFVEIEKWINDFGKK